MYDFGLTIVLALAGPVFLEEGMTTHPSILAWRSLVDYSPWGRKESDTTEAP